MTSEGCKQLSLPFEAGDNRKVAVKIVDDRGIESLFGQIPDVLEDVWVQVALGEIDKAQKTIDAVPHQHPFRLRYHRVEKVEWESCAAVLNNVDRRFHLSGPW